VGVSDANLSTIFTGVIALETLFYVVFTIALWKSTKKAADAAKASAEATKVAADAARMSAEAAKSSADITAQLNRPFVGLSHLSIESGWKESAAWRVVWAIKNFGTLPATHVDASMDWRTAPGFGGPISGPHSAELLPQAEMSLLALFSIGMNHKKVLDGQLTLEARIAVTYSSTDGRRYQHSADARWNHETAAFVILSSETQVR